jgi:hypothetical protein
MGWGGGQQGWGGANWGEGGQQGGTSEEGPDEGVKGGVFFFFFSVLFGFSLLFLGVAGVA